MRASTPTRNWRNSLAELCDSIDNAIALTGQAEYLPNHHSQTIDPEWWRRRFRLRIGYARAGADAQLEKQLG